MTLSASATARLQNALTSWVQDGSPFVYHLLLQPGGQDKVFSEILDRLDEVARGVDECYRNWWDLQNELDGEKDYANQVAYIKQALGQPVA